MGCNTIGSDQTVCVGETPDPFTNVATPTAPRTADGGTLTYQWQSRQLGGTFNDILSATSLLYSPSAVNTTTQYRRLAVITFNSVVCTMTSNIVELTVWEALHLLQILLRAIPITFTVTMPILYWMRRQPQVL